jgi:hypothetical protein
VVKVFGCRQASENRPCTNPRAAVMVYGDFEFCLVEVIPDPARLWRWRGLGERDFSPGRPFIGDWPRVISRPVAPIVANGVPGGIRRNLGVAV